MGRNHRKEIVFHKKKCTRNNKLDIDKAILYLNAHAYPFYIKSKCGHCAKAVRLSLEAGGINTACHPLSAKDYGPYLKDWGFSEVPRNNYVPQKGDIRVFQNYPGGSPHGHIDMYNGSHWVSDYIEKSSWPGPGYKKHNASFSIFR